MITRARKRLPAEVYREEEVQRLLGAFGDCPTGWRNRALVGVMYRSGLRVSEALNLFPRELDTLAGSVRVLAGKGGRSRIVGMSAGAFGLVEAWLERRQREVGLDRRWRVFCTLSGGPMSTAYVRQMLARVGRRAGLGRRVHAHGFRHTFAFQLVEEGVDVATISKLLGHSTIAITARYLDHVNPKAAIRAAAQREWEWCAGGKWLD